MASTDTWDEFLAKLDNSSNGRRHQAVSLIMANEKFVQIFHPQVTRGSAPQNPETHADKGEAL